MHLKIWQNVIKNYTRQSNENSCLYAKSSSFGATPSHPSYLVSPQKPISRSRNITLLQRLSGHQSQFTNFYFLLKKEH